MAGRKSKKFLCLVGLAWGLGPFAAPAARAAPADAAAHPAVFILAAANAESYDRGLPTLRYAHDDLARFVKVMTSTGMVASDRIVTVQDATAADLRAAFAQLARRAKGAGAGTKFIFYYTGHSDASGLHMTDQRVDKDELHALIRSVPADARIAFFDGCYSGALAAKGVKHGADFVVPKAAYDEPSGSVFFAATSDADVAYEVEELQGSLFTHDLVDGLYGAADANHDGVVTIDELYQYVYGHMSSYARSLPGARGQKPEYSVDLHGRGALVLAFVGKTTAPLTIGADVLGELQLTADGGLQIFSVTKTEPAPLQLMLVPAAYAVTVREGGQIGRATVDVGGKRVALLQRRDFAFEKASNLDTVAKGQRPRARLGVLAGATASSYTKLGPSAELEALSPAVRIESSEWRLAGIAGGHENPLYYKKQTGSSESLSALVGVAGAFYTGFGAPGEQWRLLFGGGTDYTWQRWTKSAAPLHTFGNLIPKVAVGFGTMFTEDSGAAWGFEFRREFPFATEQQTDEVLAFGANVFALSLEW